VGRQVAILVQGHQDGGNHEVLFDGGNFAAGVYCYRLKAENFQGDEEAGSAPLTGHSYGRHGFPKPEFRPGRSRAKRQRVTERSRTVGDKGGKKDKSKGQKQKAVQKEQKAQQARNKQPKSAS
jgi:hypothetical protein